MVASAGLQPPMMPGTSFLTTRLMKEGMKGEMAHPKLQFAKTPDPDLIAPEGLPAETLQIAVAPPKKFLQLET